MVRGESSFSESGPGVCLNVPFQLAWVITADVSDSSPSSFVSSFLLIELWFCSDVGWPRALGRKLAPGGVYLGQSRPAIRITLPVVGLGKYMRCSSDQRERRCLLRDCWDSFLLFKQRHKRRLIMWPWVVAWDCDVWSCGNDLEAMKGTSLRTKANTPRMAAKKDGKYLDPC